MTHCAAHYHSMLKYDLRQECVFSGLEWKVPGEAGVPEDRSASGGFPEERRQGQLDGRPLPGGCCCLSTLPAAYTQAQLPCSGFQRVPVISENSLVSQNFPGLRILPLWKVWLW